MTWVYSFRSRDSHLHFQQLGRSPDAAQRILDLVGQVADQLLVGLRLVDQPLLPVLLGLGLQRQHFDDELSGPVGLGQDHMDRRRLAVVLAQEPCVIAKGGELVAGRPFERVLQQLRLREALGEIAALEGSARTAEGIFERRIGEQHGALTGHHGHHRGQQVQRLEAGGMGRWRVQALILTQ